MGAGCRNGEVLEEAVSFQIQQRVRKERGALESAEKFPWKKQDQIEERGIPRTGKSIPASGVREWIPTRKGQEERLAAQQVSVKQSSLYLSSGFTECTQNLKNQNLSLPGLSGPLHRAPA